MKTFRDTVRQERLAITAEVPLRPDTGAPEIRNATAVLAPAVDALQFGDNLYSPGHPSTLAAAGIARECGMDSVVHLRCRDRNRIALQSNLLGAAALGVTSVILSRGDTFGDESPVRAKSVFDTDAKQLVAIAASLADFYIGSPVTVFDPADDWAATRIDEKLEAGSGFLQTQPCLNADLLHRYVDSLVERRILQRAALIVEVPLLTSPNEAMRVRDTVRGAPLPAAAIDRIAAADDSIAEGIAVCADMLRELQDIPGISGINIHYQRDARDVVAALRQAELVRSG